MSGTRAKIGKNVSLGKNINWMLGKNSYLEIGDDVRIGDNNYIIIEENASLIIEKQTGIDHFCRIRAEDEIRIGANSRLAWGIKVLSGSYEYKDIEKPIWKQNIKGPVKIGTECWIGTDSIILPNITLGARCVVGANSVVTKSAPHHSIIAGVPGRIIKQYDEKGKKWVAIE